MEREINEQEIKLQRENIVVGGMPTDDFYTKAEVDNLLNEKENEIILINQEQVEQNADIQQNATDITAIKDDLAFLSEDQIAQNENISQNTADIMTLQDDLINYSLITETGSQIVLNINSSTYVMTATLKDKNGNTIYTSNEIDLPLETMVIGATYDNSTKEIVLTLKNGTTTRFSVANLVSGLVKEDVSYNGVHSQLMNDASITARTEDENTGDMTTLEMYVGQINITSYDSTTGNTVSIGMDSPGGTIGIEATNGIQAYIPTPTNDDDLVNKKYVDDSIASIPTPSPDSVVQVLNVNDYPYHELPLYGLKKGLYIWNDNSEIFNIKFKEENSNTLGLYLIPNSQRMICLLKDIDDSLVDNEAIGFCVTKANSMSYTGLERQYEIRRNSATGSGLSLMLRGDITYMLPNKAESVSGQKTFTAIPICSVTPTANNHLVNKAYVDDLITQLRTELGLSSGNNS